jgi:hypothetical protein
MHTDEFQLRTHWPTFLVEKEENKHIYFLDVKGLNVLSTGNLPRQTPLCRTIYITQTNIKELPWLLHNTIKLYALSEDSKKREALTIQTVLHNKFPPPPTLRRNIQREMDSHNSHLKTFLFPHTQENRSEVSQFCSEISEYECAIGLTIVYKIPVLPKAQTR